RAPGSNMLDATAGVVAASKVANLAIEGDSLSVSQHAQLAERIKSPLVPTSGLVEELREIKDKVEIDEIRLAARHAEHAFAVLRATLRPQLSEKEVADDLEHQLRLFGAKGSSFPPIVAVGERAALPHARPTGKLIGSDDFVLVDWGATAQHYKSDLTRVLVTGKISPKLQRVYGVVLQAQERAIAAIRPGISGREVDRVARSVISDAGFGKFFGHGLGHGLGLDIHEAPRLNPTNDRPLAPGMVVTVEPGIYLPGWGGVRIEDDILVTRSGYEVLTDVPKELAESVVR
ncbi:MAG TPA: M24 family metallopeptidase, partial [Pirellulales bacterium]|nr:M24 family metallopeptidase [Pirellulales bacterium]